jgi:hypothetical protein
MPRDADSSAVRTADARRAAVPGSMHAFLCSIALVRRVGCRLAEKVPEAAREPFPRGGIQVRCVLQCVRHGGSMRGDACDRATNAILSLQERIMAQDQVKLDGPDLVQGIALAELQHRCMLIAGEQIRLVRRGAEVFARRRSKQAWCLTTTSRLRSPRAFQRTRAAIGNASAGV